MRHKMGSDKNRTTIWRAAEVTTKRKLKIHFLRFVYAGPAGRNEWLLPTRTWQSKPTAINIFTASVRLFFPPQIVIY